MARPSHDDAAPLPWSKALGVALLLAALMAGCLAQEEGAAQTTGVSGDDPVKPPQQSGAFQPLVNITQLPDCAERNISVSTRQLADMADIIVTGITLAAGPGAGKCETNGDLNIALDNSTDPSTNFIVIGIQCVHKGMVSCRSNEEDTKDCLILIAAPSMKDAPPCTLSQGSRYMFFLQKDTNGCDGYYLTMFERIYHSVRKPLGGTGCSFYPCYPEPEDLKAQMLQNCEKPAACKQDLCDPTISKSPCANDTNVVCDLKTCPGKHMYYNAILPEDTCYEVYWYKTSGVPTNCYGRRYINNRIRQLAGQMPANATGNFTGQGNATAGMDGMPRMPQDDGLDASGGLTSGGVSAGFRAASDASDAKDSGSKTAGGDGDEKAKGADNGDDSSSGKATRTLKADAAASQQVPDQLSSILQGLKD